MEIVINVVTLATAVGYIANQIVDLVKPRLKDMVPEAQRQVVGRLVAIIVTAILAAIAGFAAEALGYIAPGEVWLVIGAVFPATGAWFQVDSRRQISKEAARPTYWTFEDEEEEVG